MSSCFISDLHLDSKREDIKKTFFKFLESEALEFENLYILGDLFEVWIGDDYEDEFTSEVIFELKQFSLSNKNIFIMHGNRDFLLGEKFAEKCGAELIPDPLILNIKEKKIMLSHGDIFCTDDLGYQNFKEKVRNEKWQKEFLSKDLKDREEIAKNLRKESAMQNSKKEDFLMDVNKSEVEKIAQENEVDILIHGHVHRPKIHNEFFGQRIVLGDWDKKYWFISLIGEKVSLHSSEIT
jgi:UDP-2,3-diacylglucosamine hydrolase